MSVDIIDIGTPVKYRAITPTVATGITAADLRDANDMPCNCAIVTVDTNVVRFRVDGTDPTATTGNLLATGTYLFVGMDTLRQLRFIDTGAGASSVKYTTGRR